MHPTPIDRPPPPFGSAAGLVLALTFASALGLGAPSARAQDHGERMANIAAEHAQQMNDYGRMAAENYAASYEDYEEPEEDTGYYGAYSPAPAPQSNAMLLEMQYMMQATRLAQTIRAEMESDPRYQRWLNGGWDFYQSRQPAGPGEYCAATYLNRDGMITLTGVDSSWNGAMLMFVGENIPKPDRFREITATLTQTGDAPATVRVYNYERRPEMSEYGTLVFAVPTMDAALDGMTDEIEFVIAVEGQEVFRMSWKDGLAARDQLRQCVGKRRR